VIVLKENSLCIKTVQGCQAYLGCQLVNQSTNIWHFVCTINAIAVLMLKNYFIIAFRNLRRNRLHSFVNITGLSVGMAVAMLIGLWMYDELTFNTYHQNFDRMARVRQHLTNNGEVQTWGTVPYPLAETLRKEYGSDFRYVALAASEGAHILTIDNKVWSKDGVFFEPQAPHMFTLQMLKGSRDGLKDPASILIAESLAKACFGNADPMNKLIVLDNTMHVRVTGVYKDLPHNSTLAGINFMAPWSLFYSHTGWIRNIPNPWRPNAFQLFVQLADHADLNTVSARIKDVKLRHLKKDLAQKKPALFLHPMNKWHLYNEFKNGVNTGGRIQYVWLFGITGLLVLLLACINFMNLSTARSEKRAKEVGIRKAIGSLRGSLIGQFFSESLLAVAFSFILALIFVQLLLPFYNEVADKKMKLLWTHPGFWMLSLGFCVITGLIAGSYPALYLSSFKPVKVLKGTFRVGPGATIPRKVLVVLQFTVSVVLIIGTMVVYNQIQFAKDRPVGYGPDGLVALFTYNDQIHKQLESVKSELMASGAIASMAEAGSTTTASYNSSSAFSWKGKDPNLSVDFPVTAISGDYGKTIGWQLTAGRDFLPDRRTDSTGFILNETAVRFMGLTNPIGETIYWHEEPFTVIGVVKDMIAQNPYDPIKPTMYFLSNDPGVVIARINPSMGAHRALADIEKIFKKFNPGQPFLYSFVDEDHARKFGNEERIGKLAGFFTILAIFISCLGLFGMASFMAEQRTREIGVRKVLGASVLNVWGLLSKEFVVLVIIALVIAMPLAWYFMHSWLQDYYYRYEMSGWLFVAAGLGALLITIVTVSFQSVKAALMNPVKSLRVE
jgi:putative ABC transport system permease protein